jgi:hypothetical protein
LKLRLCSGGCWLQGGQTVWREWLQDNYWSR